MSCNAVLFDQSIALQSIEQMQKLAKPLQTFGIVYFAYSKIYPDGSRIFLNNHAPWFRGYHFDYYDLVPSNFNPLLYESGFYQCHELLSDVHTFEEAIHSFHIGTPVIYIEHYNRFCELYIFAFEPCAGSVYCFIKHNIDIIKHYICYFKNKAKSLIEKAEQDRHILPHARVYTKQSVCEITLVSSKANQHFLQATQIDRYYLQDYGIDAYLTKREAIFLSYLIQDMCYKQIALRMNISVRTVECYCKQLRTKLNVFTRQELMRISQSFAFLQNKIL